MDLFSQDLAGMQENGLFLAILAIFLARALLLSINMMPQSSGPVKVLTCLIDS